MALFGFGKKSEEKKACGCSCGTVKEPPATNNCCGKKTEGICCIKVLGAGCKSCHQQLEYVKQAVDNLGINAPVEYVTDMAKIAEYGVMSMPAIVVNDKVVSMGKILKTAEVEKLLE